LSPLFPRDLFGRIGLALASLFFAPLGILGAYLFIVQGHPKGIVAKLTNIVVGELFLTMAFYFICGLVWALATPQWLERILPAVTQKFLLAMIVFIVPFSLLAIWVLILH
jgi:hypothetical protein